MKAKHHPTPDRLAQA